MPKPLFLQHLGAAIASIGEATLPACLATLLREVAPYDYTVIFGYRGEARPLDLYDDFPQGRRRTFVTDYQDGPYLLDPFYLSATRPVAAGLYRLRDLAPDRFYQGEYFRTYYSRTGLAEEIGFFTDVGDGAMVVLSLMRAERPFGVREFRALEAMSPVVQSCVRRHWAELASCFSPTSPSAGGSIMDARIAESFQRFGAGVLTSRERQVVEYTLKGYSADAAGQALGISPGTVRIHRRNIYTKLRISSQGELFSRFIGTLGQG